ncbi:hydroxymethylglutaryl-CoA reductase [Spirosoma endbachense]|uniref:hydroxymethylglutaryl-CoA reductase (NADPH) n=1 Tax=Spirosoma endbachense TaxID=2666025 RepID=A0A6P1W017_9BACT|nr:hydroxymethylglutaryl-CoA reductase [Spirosoma endbachense]QHV97918.1 hydroxymethylglutaryl-CoA reductase [Spirosoma endbachense]
MFRFIPTILIKQLFTRNSLRNTPDGFTFSLKNRLADAQFTGLQRARIDGLEYPAEAFTLEPDGAIPVALKSISEQNPFAFPLRRSVQVRATTQPLEPGKHTLEITLHTQPFGTITLLVEDELQPDEPTTGGQSQPAIPRDRINDYSIDAISQRRQFLTEFSQTTPEHLIQNSFDPALVQQNCESFVGVAQVPIGLAGPLRVNGEQAQGDFLIPLATTEGTLVASYNRGIKLINLSGGVLCTVQDDAMQRAPVFQFADARQARTFVHWLEGQQRELAAEAEATSRFAKLRYVDTYLNGKLAFLRFGYETGDAAGQNMVSKATLAACNYILQEYGLRSPGSIEHFFLESNMATDKKPSQLNILRTRGKRVTAEVLIPRALLIRELQVEPEQLVHHARIGDVGARLAGTNNNGLHSANGLAALFIATGQDVACLAESSAAITYSEITPEGDLYGSITLPSLVVGTVGGGTGLPTQRECLELMGCYGTGKVNKFAEIVAGVIAAGELSLAAAISSLDWVSSHDAARNKAM